MPRLILIIGISLAILAAVNGAVFRGLAPCPDNHVAGETWYPEGCMRCDCDTEGYQCATCGLYAFDYNASQCYEELNASKPYPDCCLPKILCAGDPGFNSSKLANPPAVIAPPVPVANPTTKAPATKGQIKPASTTKRTPTPKPTPRRPIKQQNPRTQQDKNRRG